MKQLTYHHIKEKVKGGQATVENGAILSAENHAWFHKQEPQVQGYINAMFQEYKRQVDECSVKFVDYLEFPFKISATNLAIDEDGKMLSEEKKEKYSRAKRKQEDRKLAKNYYEGKDIER